MPQLTSTTIHSGRSVNFRCPYHANVMKTFDATRRSGGRIWAVGMVVSCWNRARVGVSRRGICQRQGDLDAKAAEGRWGQREVAAVKLCELAADRETEAEAWNALVEPRPGRQDGVA